MTTNKERIEDLINEAIASHKSDGSDAVRDAIVKAIDAVFEPKLQHTVAIEAFTAGIDERTVGKVTEVGRYVVEIYPETEGDNVIFSFEPAGTYASDIKAGEAKPLDKAEPLTLRPDFTDFASGHSDTSTVTTTAEATKPEADEGFADGRGAIVEDKSPAAQAFAA